MTASATPDGMRRARVAVSLAFFTFGTQLGLWFAHIPAVARRLALEPAHLGLGILGIGVIGLAMQPLAGLAIARLGGRRTTAVLLSAFVVAETLLIGAPSVPAFFAFAALVGLFGMPANIALNTLAAEFERRHGRPAMSSFHGLFSVGGLVGSLLGGQLVATGHGDGDGACVAGLVLLCAAWWASAHAPEVAPEPRAPRGGPSFAMPPSSLLGICLVVFCTALIEGSVGDWSALYLDTVKQADPALAASGYTLFSVAMAAMRFAGGALVERLGPKTPIAGGGVLMAAGMSIVVLSPSAWLGALGFLVVAVGAANIVPLMTSAAANAPGVAPRAGVAAVTTCVTLGLFAGPLVIGFVAQAWNLDIAFGLLAGIGAVVALGAAMRR